jgi:hypothetical protein
MIVQPKKENTMTNFMTSRSAIAVAALMTLGALSFSSMQAQASTPTSLGNCRAFNKEGVVKCCETYVEKYGLPAFFYDNNSSCQTAVRCSGSWDGGKFYCYIWDRNQRDERGGNQGNRGQGEKGNIRG